MTALRKPTSNDVQAVTRIIAKINAMSDADLDQFGAWDGLRDLSGRTELEAIDTGPSNIVVSEGGNFEATADIYVTLNYGPSNDGVSMSDGYLATLRGRIDGEDVHIDDIDVDVSSFYE